MQSTHNWHIQATRPIITPRQLSEALPLTAELAETVVAGRHTVQNILDRKDGRLLVIVGPCSIHDPVAAVDYARHLLPLRNELKDRMEIIMRVYFEKPRTILGWKGLINDPHLNNSCDIETGLKVGRRLLLDIVGLGMPVATEFLDPGRPWGRAPRSPRRTARWPAGFPCRWVSRTALMAAWKPPSTP